MSKNEDKTIESKRIQLKLNIEEFILRLKGLDYDIVDLTDIGNEIGIVIGKCIKDEKNEILGFDLDSFNRGLKHGFSLIDGTHGKD